MVDVAFCQHGFIEDENRHSLIEKFKGAINLLSEMKNELLNSNILFSSYVEHLEKTVLRQIIRSSRKKAYQIFDLTPTPPKTYANQSEIVNSILHLLPTQRKRIKKPLVVKYIWKKYN